MAQYWSPTHKKGLEPTHHNKNSNTNPNHVPQVILTSAILKQVMIQLQHWRAYVARSDRVFIMRISSEAWKLWFESSADNAVGSLRWRGGRADTSERTPSVSWDGVSFPWQSWIQHCNVYIEHQLLHINCHASHVTIIYKLQKLNRVKSAQCIATFS